MTTEQYLNQLKADKQSLVNNLVEKGVSATNEETFTTLVPKVLEISGGGTPSNVKVRFDSDTETILPTSVTFETGKAGIIPGYYFQTSLNTDSFKSGFARYVTNITLSSDIQTLEVFCFNNMASLVNINLDSITEIAEGVFSGCSSLLLDRLPDNVVLNKNSFQNCKKITLTELPSANTSLPYGVFDGCSSIPSFTLKDGVDISESQNAFQNCSSMSNLIIPNEATIIPTYFCNGCTALQNINLNDNIDTINNYAFQNCRSLLLEKLPSNLATLGTSSFQECVSITISEIPKGVSSIPGYCFQGCKKIETLSILGDIKSISYYSFRNSGLTTLSLPNVSAVPTGGNAMFQGTPIDTGTGSIYVPDALVENFKSATNWSGYADVIKPISEMA